MAKDTEETNLLNPKDEFILQSKTKIIFIFDLTIYSKQNEKYLTKYKKES